MLRLANDLTGYRIEAKDGEIGSVHEVYFDSETWTVRYLVVQTGNWLSDRKVLIAPDAVRDADWPGKELPVDLTQEQVRNSPPVDMERPISRQQEMEYRRYYAWPNYWGGGMFAVAAGGAYPPALSQTQAEQLSSAEEEARAQERQRREDDPDLRSSREVTDYAIKARDGDIGRVDDFLIDDDTWEIRYLVVDTTRWMPGGREVIIPPSAVRRVSWDEKTVEVDLPKEKIEQSPALASPREVDRPYEESIYRHYDWVRYWPGA
jgi:sporulation protein YlmC with PRC-barrel domain